MTAQPRDLGARAAIVGGPGDVLPVADEVRVLERLLAEAGLAGDHEAEDVLLRALVFTNRRRVAIGRRLEQARA